MANLSIQLDFRSDEPIYVQIVRQVADQVSAGALKPGDQLPTVRQLAAELRVNFNTVARAYRILDESEQISTQQGRGTFILSPPKPGLQQEIRRETLFNLVQRCLNDASRLGFTPAELRAELEDQIDYRQANNPPDELNQTNSLYESE